MLVDVFVFWNRLQVVMGSLYSGMFNWGFLLVIKAIS